ncbi:MULTISPECIES: cytochrome b/b6 domain-containing protein [unclassified Acidovorax]|uniref:cytochrome b n=1 Tax=unclassified Acidovorax TaxID=2684926 RepID=UPI002882FBB5|nr:MULTISPECIES: cytochrome b/b6 domain-containing protein [unclassified Acidovorax]
MTPIKYPAPLRAVHWLRALVIVATLAIGAIMTLLANEVPIKYATLYPWHKQLGLLALLLGGTQLLLRVFFKAPVLPQALSPWERFAARFGHVALYVLMIVVPVMGYCMSSVYEFSDGVPFFGLSLPELLPKSKEGFEWFQLIHKVLAYVLLGVIAAHVAGAVKHRWFDRNPEADVLRRML